MGVGKPGVWCQHVFAIQISRIPATGFVSLLDSSPTIAAHLMVVNQFTRPGRATCIYQVSPRQFWLFSVGFLLQIPHSPKGRPKKKSPPQRCNCRPSAALAALAPLGAALTYRGGSNFSAAAGGGWMGWMGWDRWDDHPSIPGHSRSIPL